MYYLDMDNILCSDCNFQETNSKKQRKTIINKMTTNLNEQFYGKFWNFCPIFSKHMAIRPIFYE